MNKIKDKIVQGTVSYTGNKSVDLSQAFWFSGFLWGLICMGVILNIIIKL